MMRCIFAFILLLGSVFLGTQLNYDPGYVLIKINHWTLESTFWAALLSLIFIFFTLQIIYQLVHKLLKTPQTFSAWNARRLAQKAQATTRRGLLEYSEGYWKKAKQHLIQALPNTDTPLLNYLTAARAAQKMGDSHLRDHYLREAQQSMPDAKIAVELTQAQLQLANHQWEQALATLKHLHDLAPHHPYVLKLLMELYEEIKDWLQLIELLPHIKKYQVISAQEFKAVQKRAYLHALIDLQKSNPAQRVVAFFKNMPTELSKDPDIIMQYVRFLISIKEDAVAEQLLRQYLSKEFDTRLIELYSLIQYNEKQLHFAQSLLQKYPHSPALLLCLGQLCLRQHLWGQAKDYLERSIEINPTPNAHHVLAKLYEQLNERDLAYQNFKKGLELITK